MSKDREKAFREESERAYQKWLKESGRGKQKTARSKKKKRKFEMKKIVPNRKILIGSVAVITAMVGAIVVFTVARSYLEPHHKYSITYEITFESTWENKPVDNFEVFLPMLENMTNAPNQTVVEYWFALDNKVFKTGTIDWTSILRREVDNIPLLVYPSKFRMFENLKKVLGRSIDITIGTTNDILLPKTIGCVYPGETVRIEWSSEKEENWQTHFWKLENGSYVAHIGSSSPCTVSIRVLLKVNNTIAEELSGKYENIGLDPEFFGHYDTVYLEKVQ